MPRTCNDVCAVLCSQKTSVCSNFTVHLYCAMLRQSTLYSMLDLSSVPLSIYHTTERPVKMCEHIVTFVIASQPKYSSY